MKKTMILMISILLAASGIAQDRNVKVYFLNDLYIPVEDSLIVLPDLDSDSDDYGYYVGKIEDIKLTYEGFNYDGVSFGIVIQKGVYYTVGYQRLINYKLGDKVYMKRPLREKEKIIKKK